MKRSLSVIACDYALSTRGVAKGSIAYVLDSNPGGGNSTLPVLVQTPKGKWVNRWEPIICLSNFRLATVPDTHSQYAELGESTDVRHLAALQKMEHI
jgi:hypothetical protein